MQTRLGTGGENLRFHYDSGDQFFVDTDPATIAQFEAALSVGDDLAVDYDTDGVSVFELTNN